VSGTQTSAALSTTTWQATSSTGRSKVPSGEQMTAGSGVPFSHERTSSTTVSAIIGVPRTVEARRVIRLKASSAPLSSRPLARTAATRPDECTPNRCTPPPPARCSGA